MKKVMLALLVCCCLLIVLCQQLIVWYDTNNLITNQLTLCLFQTIASNLNLIHDVDMLGYYNNGLGRVIIYSIVDFMVVIMCR